jgi:PAS domain S-box-containing protein
MKRTRSVIADFSLAASQPSARPAWLRYAVALGSVAIGWLAREALTPAVGLPFIFFFPAIAIAAWYGGLAPSVLATMLAALAANWFFLDPVHTFALGSSYDVAATVAFLFACVVIVGAIEAMHRAKAHLVREVAERQRVEAELAGVRERFATTLGSIRQVAGARDALRTRDPFLKVEAHETKPGTRLIGLVFLAAAVLLVASTIFVYRVGLIRIHAQEKMASQLLVLRQLDDFLSSVKDTETGQRGYLLTGDDPYLEPYTNVRAQVQTKLEGLHRLALSGELPKNKVERVAALTQQKLSELEETIQLRREKGLEAALRIMRDDRGRQVMDEIRSKSGQMRADEEKEFAAANVRANWAATLRTETFVAACLLNLAFLGWAFRKISREVGRREAASLETSRQKELLATTLASIGDAVIATDAGSRVIFLNPEAEKLTGWKSSEAAGRPLTEIFRIVNQQTRAAAENPVEKVLRLGAVVGLANHTLLIARDGREIPIDDSAAPIRQPDGPLFGIVLVFRDFTEHKRAEQSLRESQERLARLINSAMDAIIAVDAQQRITLFNPAAERMFGCRAAEAVGGSLDRFIPARFREAHRSHIGKFGQTGVTNRRMGSLMPLTGLRANGEEFPIEASIAQVEVGGQKIFKVILRDITERKQAERRLSASYAVTRILAESPALSSAIPSVLQAIGEGLGWDVGDMWTLDLESNTLRCTNVWHTSSASIEEFNTASSAITLSRGSGLPGRVWESLKPVYIADVREDSNFVRASQAVAVGLQAGFAFPIATGEKFLGVMEFFSLGSREPDDALLKMFAGIGSQIGQFVERKRAEDALAQANSKLAEQATSLEKTVAERTASLRETVHELESWSYSIAHDMRAPLRSMQGYANFLKREYQQKLDDAARNYLQRIVASASRLDALITDVLNYSKIAQQELDLYPVHLEELIDGIVESYPNLQASKLDLEVDRPLPAVLANAGALTQVISNLLDNAVKFVKPGMKPRVRIRAELRTSARTAHLRGQIESAMAESTSSPPSNVDLALGFSEGRRTALEGPIARLWFEDNGIGIPSESLERIFGMFQRLHRQDQYDGTGIGLAIVRKAVDRMGGATGVESAPGHGSRFWVELRQPKT